jgi:D-serine deaminase-like pyridoxal phosphate-dependent protein
MKKDFIVSKIEASQDGSQFVFIEFTDPNEPKSTGRGGGYPQSPFRSPEDLMKNLPKVMSNMYGAGEGMPGNSPTFKITMKEYEDMAIKVGDRVRMEINKVDSGGI